MLVLRILELIVIVLVLRQFSGSGAPRSKPFGAQRYEEKRFDKKDTDIAEGEFEDIK